MCPPDRHNGLVSASGLAESWCACVCVYFVFKSIVLPTLIAFSFYVQPNLKPLWGSQTTAGEAGVEEEAEGEGMETSDREGTWGMASQRARLGCIQTRCPVTTHPTGKGTHLQRSEWREWFGSVSGRAHDSCSLFLLHFSSAYEFGWFHFSFKIWFDAGKKRQRWLMFQGWIFCSTSACWSRSRVNQSRWMCKSQ